MNKMREIRIEKVTLNIGIGESGDRLDKAAKLLELLTKSKPIKMKTMKRIPTWGIRPKLNIATKVTLRGKKAEDVLSRLLKAKKDVLEIKKFDKFGNFSFGIKEYLDIPGIEYQPDIGIIGLEAAITLERPGFKIKKGSIPKKIGKKHLITKEESMEFIKNKFKIQIVEKGEEE